ncbi:hypothetical protein ACHAXR_001308, partial [Thalassiosira sp. AJA248-18]
MTLLHILECIVEPPAHLPDIFPVLWSFVGCGLFCISYLATIWAITTQTRSKKKQYAERQIAGKKVKPKNRLSHVSVLGTLLLLFGTSSAFLCSPCHHYRFHIAYTNGLLHLSSEKQAQDMGDILTDEILERARRPLTWEVQNAQDAKPVLDLSTRNSDLLPLADGGGGPMSTAEDENIQVDAESWEDGHVWQVTKQHLLAMSILSHGDTTSGTKLTPQKVLTEAPQLLRLPTPQVVEAASFLLSYPSGSNSTDLVETDPSLLTYCAEDLQYGLEEYLPNMMFMGNRTLAAQMIQTQLTLSPSMAMQLVRMGVSGGLEERRISRALGSAGKSSGKAAEGVVGEMGRSYK